MGYDWNANNLYTLVYDDEKPLLDLHWLSQVIFGVVKASLSRVDVVDTDSHSNVNVDISNLMRRDLGEILAAIAHPDYSDEITDIIVDLHLKDHLFMLTMNTPDRTTHVTLRADGKYKFFPAAHHLLMWGKNAVEGNTKRASAIRPRAERMIRSTEVTLRLAARSALVKN